MTVLPVAHAGHWALYIIYAVPVIVVLISAVVTTRREKREAAAREADGSLSDE